jgi:hypothetical protein
MDKVLDSDAIVGLARLGAGGIGVILAFAATYVIVKSIHRPPHTDYDRKLPYAFMCFSLVLVAVAVAFPTFKGVVEPTPTPAMSDITARPHPWSYQKFTADIKNRATQFIQNDCKTGDISGVKGFIEDEPGVATYLHIWCRQDGLDSKLKVFEVDPSGQPLESYFPSLQEMEKQNEVLVLGFEISTEGNRPRHALLIANEKQSGLPATRP